MRGKRRLAIVAAEGVLLVGLAWLNGAETDNGLSATVPQAVPVRIDVWSDFQCADCRRFATTTLPSLEATFVRTGGAVVIWHDAPMLGPASTRAAEAAACADDQQHFWQYHDALFAEPPASQDRFDAPQLEQVAHAVGLDEAAFDACLASGTHSSDVRDELDNARRLGVTSVPTLFVNDQVVAGTPRFLELSALVEAAMGDAASPMPVPLR